MRLRIFLISQTLQNYSPLIKKRIIGCRYFPRLRINKKGNRNGQKNVNCGLCRKVFKSTDGYSNLHMNLLENLRYSIERNTTTNLLINVSICVKKEFDKMGK